MGQAQLLPLAIEDYEALPETGPRYQLVEGDLYMAPAPNRFHQDVSANLLVLLRNYLRKRPIGVAYCAPFDVYLNEINAFQPDIIFVSKKNKILTKQGASGAPDLVIEVLSPGTASLDKSSKRRVYARTGVKELWLIDPELKLVSVYFLQKNPNRPAAVHKEQDMFTSPLLPVLKFKGLEIFRQG